MPARIEESSFSRHGRSLLLRTAALSLGLLVSLAAAELLIRGFSLAPSTGIGTATEATFERLPGLFLPHQDLVDTRIPELPHRVRTNSLGYRGPEVAIEKRPDELRVLMLGDSFTYGDYVEDEETLPARAEALLRDECDATVINAGVGGTTIVTHAAMAERSAVLEPDLVVLTFSENDVRDLADPMWYALERNRAAKSRPPLSLVYPVLRHTALWNLGLEGAAKLRVRAQVRETERAEAERSVDRWELERPLRARYGELLLSLRNSLAARDIPLVFGIFPGHFSIYATEERPLLSWIEATIAKAGLVTVNFRQALSASGVPTDALYLLPHDGHPSPTGHALAAQALVATLDQASLLGRGCANRFFGAR